MPGARNIVPGTLLLQLIPEGGGCSSQLPQNRHAGQRFTAIPSDWRQTSSVASFDHLPSSDLMFGPKNCAGTGVHALRLSSVWLATFSFAPVQGLARIVGQDIRLRAKTVETNIVSD
jgi:hypothetical protein